MRLTLISLLLPFLTFAARLHGRITDDAGKPIAFASITLKGTTIGTTSNASGDYVLELLPGNHVVQCRHVGFAKQEQSIRIENPVHRLDFSLKIEQLTMTTVVVKPGGEDPAYAIIREAIRARPRYLRQVKGYACDAYIKGLFRLDSFPSTFMGQRVDFEDGDSGQQRMLFLSETLARISVEQPNLQSVQVLSTRVSGSSDSYGLADPRVISFYENNVEISKALNPRGFVSPIADNAFQFYRFRYRGAFFEDGRQIAKIEVIPKRPYDPIFKGYINIVDQEWSIHSLELRVDRQAQLAFLDRLDISQVYLPLPGGVWMVQSQHIIPYVRKFGFNAGGYFSTVFSRYDIEPAFSRGTFGRTILRYDSASNRRTRAWWDSIRPTPLLADEQRDFLRKDSLEGRRKDPAYLDSLDSIRNRISPMALLLTGQTIFRRSQGLTYNINPLIKSVGFNTVEGLQFRVSGSATKELAKGRSLAISPIIRYGVGNQHFNTSLAATLRTGKKSDGKWTLDFGRGIFQFNGENPISPISNTANTLLFGNNFMKIYEAGFAGLSHTRELAPGLTFTASLRFQDRYPLENTDTTTFWGRRREQLRFTPNRVVGWSPFNISRHQAFLASFTLRYRPGARFIEFPDRRQVIPSTFPLISLNYTKGLPGLLGGDADFDRWKATVSDEVEFGRMGRFKYRVTVGGFLSNRRVELPDLQHFNGNQLITAASYLNAFQLAPYYSLAQNQGQFTTIHLQHELLGAVTNRIPLIRRLDLHLVGGLNMLYRSPSDHYLEAFGGVDNILNTIRVDWIRSWDAKNGTNVGIRMGIRLLNVLLSDD